MNKPKVVAIGADAKERIMAGVDLVANAVKITHGPYGKNAVSGLQGVVKITNDGVSVANDIWSEDVIENLGIRTIREVATKTNDEVGEGTTTAIVLAQATLKALTVKSKLPARELARKVSEELKEIVEKLTAAARPVVTKEELVEVAKVSVEDDTLAQMIGETQYELGQEGTILAEESNNKVDSIEKIRGVRLDNGFGTSLAINDPTKQRIEIKNARLILTNHTLTGANALAPLADVIDFLRVSGVQDIILIARAFDENAIRICLESARPPFNLRIMPVNAPYIDQTQVMMDIAAVTGATFINYEERGLNTLIEPEVGYVSQAHIYRFSSVITGPTDDKTNAAVAERIATLKKNFEGSESEFEKKGIESRISQLQDGFALLKIGADSIVERKYKKDKVDDCVNATKLALKFGTVKGGGLALKEIADELPDTYLLKNALKAPYAQIQLNAGEPFEIPDWCRDPLQVLKVALTNAVSVAAKLSTIEVAYDWANDKPRYVQETKRDEE